MSRSRVVQQLEKSARAVGINYKIDDTNKRAFRNFLVILDTDEST